MTETSIKELVERLNEWATAMEDVALVTFPREVATAFESLSESNARLEKDLAVSVLVNEELEKRLSEARRERDEARYALEKSVERVERDRKRMERFSERETSFRLLLIDVRRRITHKSSCPLPASNFQKRKPCQCGRDAIIDRIDALMNDGMAQLDRAVT